MQTSGFFPAFVGSGLHLSKLLQVARLLLGLDRCLRGRRGISALK
jgi:hypothetical protein